MGLFLTDYPITEAKLREMLDLLLAGESVTSLWMPHSARTDFAIKLQAKQGLDLKETEFLILDLSLGREFLEKKYEEAKNKAMNMVSRGKSVVLILDNFSFTDVEFVKYVFSLRHELPPKKLVFLALAFESEFYATRTNKTDVSLVYNNIVKVPYFTRGEALDWLSDEYDSKTKDKIYQYCGGIVGLLINFVRGLKKFKDAEKVVESEQMRNTVEHLWGRFSQRERYVMKSIVKSGKVPPYTFELNYMKQHNLISNDNKIIGDWVKSVVDVNSEEEVKIEGEKITWNGMELNELFGPKEEPVLKRLLEEKEVSRDEVAKIMWGSQAVDKYSDWAIDQLFSRLRKKLDNVGLGGERLKTLKGKGFRIEGIKLV